MKAREGNSSGVKQHAERARDIFQKALKLLPGADDRFMGLELVPLVNATSDMVADPEKYLNVSDDPVVVVFSFKLFPSSEGGIELG